MARVFGKYEITSRLAVGGMGEVYLAKQAGVPGFERPAIVKTLLPDLAQDPAFIQQFLDEARVAATLNHPNIVSIYEVGQWEGVWFIAMELIRGRDVSKLSRRAAEVGARVPASVSARIVRDAALGLAHAHQARDASGKPLGIVHRDISPNNLMVREDGLTKVVDFGIALAANRAARTATGTIKGKLGYMAPEQITDRAIPASDQYSLGIVLWELLTGTRLFQAENELKLLKLVAEGAIPLPSTVREVPKELEEIAMRMVARDPAQRFPSCAEVANRLDALADRGPETETLFALLGPAPAPKAESGISSIPDLAPRGTAPAREAATVVEGTPRGASPVPEVKNHRKRIVAGLLGTILVAAAAGVLAWQHSNQPKIAAWAEPVFRKNAALGPGLIDRFCAETADVAREQRLQPVTHNADAAEFFAPLLGWQGSGITTKGKLTLSPSLEAELKGAGDDWPEKLAGSARTMDFSWMKEATKYDHWTITGGGIGRDLVWPSPIDWPVPLLMGLGQWSKFRFALAIENGDMESAVTEVRHLGDLCASTPWLLGDAYKIGLLQIEAKAIETARHRGIRTDAWEPLSDERRVRWRAVLFASPGFLVPGVQPEVRQRALECMSWNKCAAITEAVAQATMIGVGRSKDVDDLIAAAARSGCTDNVLLQRIRGAQAMTDGEVRLRAQTEEIASSMVLLSAYAAVPDAGR